MDAIFYKLANKKRFLEIKIVLRLVKRLSFRLLYTDSVIDECVFGDIALRVGFFHTNWRSFKTSNKMFEKQ